MANARTIIPGDVEALCQDLPDVAGARLFWEEIAQEQPRVARKLLRNEGAGLRADVLALAAWSPFLATTLVQNPAYFSWLERQRALGRVKTREELSESLARFALTNSQLNPQILLARFRRRELLRVYLRDLRRTATLVETIEELSNIADAILAYALDWARHDLDNKYGTPLQLDERGRAAPASFCIVALGKLGSGELNYASDIDLLFLYEASGSTSGTGTRGVVTNREYFCKLAETVARLAGQPTGEGAAYRVDLRLRPYGRDGALASSLAEAVQYYCHKAQAWELQALIRARAAAGDAALYARFAARLHHRVYPTDKTVARALADVRLAKQKIDQYHAPRAQSYNVKLGRGGVREIEFIAQALQLAFGGHDEWLRAPHTLISLGRLSDRQLITERELSELAEAYVFLRTVEHRLQMEHGLQTHLVPDDAARRALVARRMDFTGETALEDFAQALQGHTENVSRAFARVFAATNITEIPVIAPEKVVIETTRLPPVTAEAAETLQDAPLHTAAQILAWRLGASVSDTLTILRETANATHNPRRALHLTTRTAVSLDKWPEAVPLTAERLRALVQLCGASDFLGGLTAQNPALIQALPSPDKPVEEPDARRLLNDAVASPIDLSADLAALRRVWSPLLFATGAHDAAGRITTTQATQRQTALAEAALEAALTIAQKEMARRCGIAPEEVTPCWAVLGLGRLGSGGMDYGSDLDLILVYDDAAPSPVATLPHAESYRRLAELLTMALSSLTRDGYLYRVDLRLRPDGRNGPTALGAQAFKEYLAHRAAAWEWLAYVKLRDVAGAADFASNLAQEARQIIHKAAQSVPHEHLREETRRVRARLEAEKARRGNREVDIKYGAGGLLDVYFMVRYLQLRDNVPDTGADRSTTATLARLHAAGSLDDDTSRVVREGYAFLRALDHRLRLVVGRATRLPAIGHATLQDIAHGLGATSAESLLQELTVHRQQLRAAYDKLIR